jgi:hypothetical protein
MTAPNQALPPGITKWLGVGAYEIGGADSNFGQLVDEDYVNTLVKIPLATFLNMFDVLEEVLLKLPIDILEAFKPFIPDWLEDEVLDVVGAVTKILASLDVRQIPVFLQHLLDLFNITDLFEGNNLFTNLQSFLDPLGLFTGDIGDFDLLEAAENFITEILDPTGLLAKVADFVESFLGIPGDLSDLTDWVGDLLGLFGNPTGLGTGSPGLGALSSIPIFGPLFGLFGGASGTTQATNFFTSLQSLLGNPSGLLTGSPTVPSLSSIPILGPVFGLFGGAANSTQAGNFGTSILSLLGNPTGVLTGSPTVPPLSSIPILGPVFGLFGGATTSTQAGNFFTNLASLLGGPTLTTTPGSFSTTTAATNFVNSILSPTGLLATLSGGLLSTGVIPNLAQSKIINLPTDLSSLSTNVSNAVDFTQDTIDGLLGALRGIPIIGGLIPDLSSAIKTSTVNLQNFTISALDDGYRNPTWVCRYPIGDVTYLEALNGNLLALGNTGAASAGTAHTHPMQVDVQTAAWNIHQDESIGGYVTISKTNVFDTIGIVCLKPAGTLNNVFLELFRENYDGSLTRLSSTNIAASITTTNTYIETTLSPSVICQEGERYVIRVRNSSTVATNVSLVGLQTLTATLDAASFTTVGSSLTTQTSYTAAQATTAQGGNVLGWALIAAKTLPQADKSYSDDFNRANLGPWWATFGTAPIVIASESATYGGSTNGDEQALYIRSTAGDASRVEAALTIGAGATTQRFGIMMHANRELTQYVYLSVTGSDAKIYSWNGTTLTQRATVAVGGTANYALYYDVPNDKYVALQNNAAFGLQWTGVSSAITHDANARFGGVVISRASGVNAGGIDNWTLRDWKP